MKELVSDGGEKSFRDFSPVSWLGELVLPPKQLVWVLVVDAVNEGL